MHTRCVIALLVAALAGCQSAPETADESPAQPAQSAQPEPPATEPAPPAPVVSADAFDRVFQASVDVLRDWRFVVNRKDRRQGVVSAAPRIAASIVEPWQPDATRSDRTWESTVNYQRRRVRVELVPTDPATVIESGPATGPFQLRVTCHVDRRYYPPSQLIDAAVTKIRFSRSRDVRRPVRTEQGAVGAHWEPVGRDPVFEQELAEAILGRAAQQPAATAEAAP